MANILYFGTLNSYVTQNDILVFRKNRHDLTIINVYPIDGNCKEGLIDYEKLIDIYDADTSGKLIRIDRAIARMSKNIIVDCFKLKAKKFREIFKDNAFDMVYASWGSNMIPYMKIIQKAKLKVPIVYNFLSYPQNVYKWKVFLENWYCQKTIENLDGRIHATEEMYRYMINHFNLRKHGLDTVITPFFSKRYRFRRRLPLLSEYDGEPHIVYIGPMSLPWDDIRQEIYEITREKIHFHMAQPNVSIKSNPYLHFFPYFPLPQLTDGSLATFMTQFDACIVLFNFKACSCMDRFYNSFPSRFLFALNAGIPVVMPKGYLPECEKFVNEHQIGFAYGNLAQLKMMLNDEDLMRRCRRNALKKTADFTYEKEFHKLDELIKAVS